MGRYSMLYRMERASQGLDRSFLWFDRFIAVFGVHVKLATDSLSAFDLVCITLFRVVK
jgi:hypothetical protein